ncbi:MAG: WD40 repeat domain-containing protein [Candidatus Acidiferrales bacterium]
MSGVQAAAAPVMAPPAPPYPAAAAAVTVPAPKAPTTAPAGSLTSRVLNGHRFWIWGLAFSPDGRWLASGGTTDHTAILWDAVEGRELRTFPGTLSLPSVDFSPDGRLLALAASDDKETVSSISLWDSANPEQLRNLVGHQGPCFCVRFSPDGRLLASTEGGMTINLWDVSTGQIIKVFKQGPLRSKAYGGQFRSALAFSPDGRYLASRSWPATLWNVASGEQVLTFGPEYLTLFATIFVGFTPDSRSLVEVRGNGTIRVWDVATGKLASVLADPPNRSNACTWILCAALSKDGRHLAVACNFTADEPKGKDVVLWDVPSARPLGTVPVSDGSWAVVFSPDGQWLAVTDTLCGDGKSSGIIKFVRVSEIR